MQRDKRLEPVDYPDLQNFSDIYDSDIDFENAEFGNINPDLIDFIVVPNDESHSTPVPDSFVERLLLPNNQFYRMCSQLSDMQHHLFNFFNEISSRI